MNQSGGSANSERPRKLLVWGCPIGCLVLLGLITFLTIAAVRFVGKSGDPSETSVPPSFQGVWVHVNGGNKSVLRIGKNGQADFRRVGPGTTFSINGAARYNPTAQTLSVKILIWGPSWHIDEPPHPWNGRFVMKLTGEMYDRIDQTHPTDSGSPMDI